MQISVSMRICTAKPAGRSHCWAAPVVSAPFVPVDGLGPAAADEPTNDADVDLLRALEDALLAWPGTVMCISHDRYFLDRICSHILAFEGDSQVI